MKRKTNVKMELLSDVDDEYSSGAGNLLNRCKGFGSRREGDG